MLGQDHQPEQQPDGRLQGQQRPERRRRHVAQGEHVEGVLQDREQQGQPGGHHDDPDAEVAGRLGHPEHRGRQGGDGHGEGQRGDAGETVADVLGEHEEERVADRPEGAVPEADEVDVALPRLGQGQDAEQGEPGPDQGPGAVALHGGDDEGAEELDRDGGAQGEPLDRGEEADGDQAARDAEREQGRHVLPPHGPQGRAGHQQEEQPAERQPQPGRPGSADLLDERHRQRGT